MKNLLIILLLFLAFGCNIEKRIARKCRKAQAYCPAEVRIDSVYIYRETIRDTTITVYTPVDSLSIMDLVICDEQGNAQLRKQIFKSDKQKIEIEIKDGVLITDCNTIIDSLKFKLFLKDKEIMINKSRKEIIKITSFKTRIVDYICRTTVGLLLLLLIIYLIYKIK